MEFHISNPRAKPSNRVRISAGLWKSRVLDFPNVAGLRPTGDRIRQTVFNWLGQSMVDLHCLDAFAGSGALGFEAASRGAASVVLCEADRDALAALHRNATQLGATQCRVVAADVLQWLSKRDPSAQAGFDVVFCDPPFAASLHLPFLRALKPHLADAARIYVESPVALSALAAESGFEMVKSARAGAVHFGLLGLPDPSSLPSPPDAR